MRFEINQIKVGVILSYISRVITVIVGVIYTPIMIRLLGQNEYGIYNIAASTISYLGVFSLGFGSAYIRFFSRYEAEANEEKIAVLNAMFLTIFSVLGVVAIAAGLVLAFNVDLIFGTTLSASELNTTRILITILVIHLGLSLPLMVFNTYILANEHFIFQNALLIVSQVASPFVKLPLLLAGYGSIGMVVGMTVLYIAVDLVSVYYSLRKMNMRFKFKGFDRALMKEMLLFSSLVFMNLMAEQVNNNVDKTILGRFGGTVPVAIYSVASNLYHYYILISVTISQFFTPRIHRMVAMNEPAEEFTALFTRVGRIQFMILSLVMSGFIFFGRPFVGMWAGPDYYEAYLIAIILMLAGTVPLIQNIGIEIQQAKNMFKFRSWLYLGVAFGNIVISIPLAQRFGALGATAGTALAIVVGNGLIMNRYYHKTVGINIRYFWREISQYIPSLMVPVIYGVVITQFVDLYQVTNLFIYGMIYVLLFVGSTWFVGMNEYEKLLLRNPFS
jgi:O-antigen/teichoic acid export membrane protein